MPLRKSPIRTPALLAANRANCLKSTGPRTRRGKARVCLNALKHGRHAHRLPEKLARAGYYRELALYSRIHTFICRALLPVGPFEQGVVAALAVKACCLPRLIRKTKPESRLDSIGKALLTRRTGIQVKDYRRRIGLVFWVQRRTSPKPARPERSRRESRTPNPAQQLEDGVRCWVHRLRKPRWEERIRYSLDHAGIYRPELEAEHWKKWPELCRLWGTRTCRRLEDDAAAGNPGIDNPEAL